jgi:hypothetical protein
MGHPSTVLEARRNDNDSGMAFAAVPFSFASKNDAAAGPCKGDEEWEFVQQ